METIPMVIKGFEETTKKLVIVRYLLLLLLLSYLLLISQIFFHRIMTFWTSSGLICPMRISKPNGMPWDGPRN